MVAAFSSLLSGFLAEIRLARLKEGILTFAYPPLVRVLPDAMKTGAPYMYE